MNNAILQGTTPSLTIHINPDDLELIDIVELELTFQQYNKDPTIIKHISDCEIDFDNNTITYHFSETETHSFKHSFPLKWQLRFITSAGEIVGTETSEIQIYDLISKEVMTS